MSLKRARVSAFVTILSISLSLSLIGIFGLVGQNVKDVFLRFYKEVQLEVFLDPSLSASRIDQLKNRISQNVQVDDVIFISREQALEEFRKTFGEDLKGILSENPLPPSFRVIMKPSYS
ncbi:MAG: permease-like cell division protein FtsX, partial [Calditrichia bacterium]